MLYKTAPSSFVSQGCTIIFINSVIGCSEYTKVTVTFLEHRSDEHVIVAYFGRLNIVFSPNGYHYPEDQISKVMLHFLLVFKVGSLVLAMCQAVDDSYL